MSSKTKNWNQLLSPIFVSSVIVLIINDFFLKFHYGGFITGKLSDFAGLFGFAFFWSAIFSSRFRLLIYSLCAVLFILWKSPLGIHFIDLWNTWAPYTIGRVEDYWDLTAIILLPFGYRYQKNLQVFLVLSTYRIILRKGIIIFSLFAFLATAGGHGNKIVDVVNVRSENIGLVGEPSQHKGVYTFTTLNKVNSATFYSNRPYADNYFNFKNFNSYHKSSDPGLFRPKYLNLFGYTWFR